MTRVLSVQRARDEFVLGNRLRFSSSFVDADSGNPTDPTAVTFSLKRNGASEQTYTYGVDADLIRDSEGEFHILVEPEEEGLWRWYWVGTGDVVAATEGSFKIVLDYA